MNVGMGGEASRARKDGDEHDTRRERLAASWQVASAALIEAECRDPYNYEVDDLTDEVNAARLALSQAGVRDIEAFAQVDSNSRSIR